MNVLKLSFLDFLKEFALIFGPERIISLKHYIIEDSQRPHISVNRTVVIFGDNLGRHVGWGPTKGIDGLIFGASQAEAEVNKLELLVPIDEDIFSLDIPMHDIPAMKVL